MSVRRRSTDELVVDNSDDGEESVFEAYIDGEDFVIYPADNPDQWIAAKHPVEIEQ